MGRRQRVGPLFLEMRCVPDILSVLIIMGAYSSFGRRRVRHLTAQTDVKQHSLDGYHGAFVMACVILPAFSFAVLWSGFAPLVIENWLHEFIANSSGALTNGEINVLIAEAKPVWGLSMAVCGPEQVEAAAYLVGFWKPLPICAPLVRWRWPWPAFIFAEIIAPRFAVRQS